MSNCITVIKYKLVTAMLPIDLKQLILLYLLSQYMIELFMLYIADIRKILLRSYIKKKIILRRS